MTFLKDTVVRTICEGLLGADEKYNVHIPWWGKLGFGTVTFFSVIVPLLTLLTTGLLSLLLPLLRARNLPRGPLGLPIIGAVYRLLIHPPQEVFRLMTKKFGKIFTFYLGETPAIILNDKVSIDQVFSDQVFAARPKIFFFQNLVKFRGVGWTEGKKWAEMRDFSLRVLETREYKVDKFEPLILQEVDEIIRTLQQKKGHDFNPRTLVFHAMGNVMAKMLFGHRFAFNGEEKQKFERICGLMDYCCTSIGFFNLVQVYPILRFVPPYLFTWIRFRSAFNEILAFVDEEIADREMRYKETLPPTCLLDAFLREMKLEERAGKAAETRFTRDELRFLLLNWLSPGVVAIGGQVLWGLLYLLENKNILKQAQLEIDQNIERDRPIVYGDKDRIPFTKALCMEAARLASVVPLSLLHSNFVETQYRGYTIPKRSIICGNLYAVHRDPANFPDPERFDPLRFLDSTGKLIHNRDDFMPFSVGLRQCAGESLAKMEMFMVLANLIREMDILLPEQHWKAISTEHAITGLIRMPEEFEVAFVPRDASKGGMVVELQDALFNRGA